MSKFYKHIVLVLMTIVIGLNLLSPVQKPSSTEPIFASAPMSEIAKVDTPVPAPKPIINSSYTWGG